MPHKQKQVRKQYAAGWYQRNKVRVQQTVKAYAPTRRLRRYNLTVEAYERLLIRHDYRCHICRGPFLATPCIDHCHTTGKVRGLLCGRCNSGLGRFGDSLVLLQLAVEYLQGVG